MTYITDIERLNYYEGEFLGAVDFQAEQEYHRDMRRRHNLGQHTWGIVAGLDLVQAPNGGTNNNGTEVDVYLQPGMAVDGFGREILVLGQAQLTAAMLAAYYSSNPTTPVPMYVWIAYEESMLQPPSDACAAMNVSSAYARIGETYTLTVTATSTPPPNGAIVVDGVQMTVPVEPAASSSSSSGSNPIPDPPPVTLPYDDSVPFQEFSTDDSTLNWWLPLGQVLWDSYNQVFLQTANNEPVSSVISPAYGRIYAGNVSSIAFAPGGMYTIVDRDSPYPAPPGTDPNLGGVQAEVAGSLQVDYLLNATMNALIGVEYVSGSKPALSPLTIIADSSSGNQELIQFRTTLTEETWHICQNLSGAGAGINFGEIVSGAAQDGRLFLQTGGNVGVGTTNPQQNLSVNAAINLDQAAKNSGKLNPGLTFGTNSTEGIASNRGTSGPNPGGLDFYTNSVARLSISHNGSIGIGTASPGAGLDLAAGPIHVGQTTNPTLSAQGAYLGWNVSGGVGETDFINNQGLGTGGFAFINTPNAGAPPTTLVTIAGGGNVGIGTTSPQQNLSVNFGLNIDQENTNPGGPIPTTGANKALTFGSGSGEGIGSCRTGGNNQFGLDFYTDYQVRLSVAHPMNGGGVLTTGNLTIGATAATAAQPAPGTLTVNGDRTYLMGVDVAGNHWIMSGGVTEGTDNAICFNPATRTITIGSGGTNWNLNVTGKVNGTKVGYVADRFINRDDVKLERGDVVVLHPTPSTQYYGSNSLVPLVEVQLTDASMDTRVCGIVDEPALTEANIGDLDRKKLGSVQVGLMVTLGAYAYCKVDADVAPISPGDLLITSPTPGYAQKLYPGTLVRPGAIIGKALGTLESGKGTIPVLFSHQ
jgi:hypothetical protein